MHQIDLYCRKCKKSLRMSYIITGNEDAYVLENIVVKCHHCKRALVLKKYTEAMLIKNSVDGKVYL